MALVKYLICTVIILLSLTIFIPQSFAQGVQTTPPPDFAKILEDNLKPVTKDNYNAAKQFNYTILNAFNTMGCIAEGFSIYQQGCVDYVFNKGEVKLQSYQFSPSGGALGAITTGIALMYLSPPASGIEYMASTLRDFGVIKPAYAQVAGSGAAVLEPIKRLWQAMANIAYIGLTLILLVIGLMIMFRTKLDQRTVVGIQQALPGVVLAIILVYFSFFIAGLVIDIAFVGSRMIGVALVSTLRSGPGTDPAAIVNNILNNQNVFNIFGSFISLGGIGTASGEISGALGDLFGAGRTGSIAAGIASAVSLAPVCLRLLPSVPAVLACLGGAAATPTILGPQILYGIVYVVIIVALVTSLIRLFLALVGAFASIVLSIIFAPFLIMFSAIPGNGGAFVGWLKGLIANVLIFPAVFAMFILVAAILNFGAPWGFDTPPVTNVSAFTPLPLFGGLTARFIQFIIAFGILLATPGVPDFIRGLLKTEEPKAIKASIEKGLGAGTGAVEKIFKGATALIK